MGPSALALAATMAASIAPPLADAYAYVHPTSSPLVFDPLIPLLSNALVKQDETSFLTNSGGGVAPTVDPSTVKTYGSGLVALYRFDNYTKTTMTVTTPCGLPAPSSSSSPACADALLTSTDADVALADPETVLFGPGRFEGGGGEGGGGSSSSSLALRVSPLPHVTSDPASVGTFAQIPYPAPWMSGQPARGMAGAAWIKFAAGAWSDGVVWERQFDNFDLSLMSGRCFYCEVAGQDNVRFSVSHCLADSTAAGIVASSGWIHLACSYSGSDDTLSFFINGTLGAEKTAVTLPYDLFRHGDNQPFGIGNRPGTSSDPLRYAECCGSSAFSGYIDDFALWDRPLTSEEVADLASSEKPLITSPRIVLTTQNVVRVLDSVPSHPSQLMEREFEAVTVNWTASSSPTGDGGRRLQNSGENGDYGLVTEISTDGGLTWCRVENGQPFSDLFHGDPEGQSSCLFPSVTIQVRVIWTGTESVALVGLTVDFWAESPLLDLGGWENVDIGMNAVGVTYYQSQWVFTDVFKSAGGSSWPAVRSGTDSNGWPLEIDPNLDDDGSYWITGRNIILRGTKGTYPAGIYTLISEGNGTIRLSWDSGSHAIESPCRHEFNVIPTDAGVELHIQRSQLGDHVRNVRVYMPGYAPEAILSVPDPTSASEAIALEASDPGPTHFSPGNSAPEESYCITCLEGVVGHWSFDQIEGGDSNVTSSANGDVVVRGASPSSLAGSPSTLAGNGSAFPLVGDGKFGRGLDVPPGKANWASVFPSGLLQTAPTTGFAGSIWLRPAGTEFSQGTIWEHMFGNFELFTWAWRNNLRCRVRSTDGMPDIGYAINEGGPLDPTTWLHAVCTYDPSTATFTLYVDGVAVANGTHTFPGGKFLHGDGQALGIGNRAGSVSNPGQYANNGHFEGALDDFTLWNRHLDSDEVKKLFESGRPLLDQKPPQKDCISCLQGIVGHYEFDETSAIVSSANGTVIIRGTSTALVGEDATITGDGNVPPLVSDGRFGSALSIPPMKANWIQIFPSGLRQNAPAIGFAASLWLRPPGTSFVAGRIFERMFDNFGISTWPYALRCRIKGIDNQLREIGYTVKEGGPLVTSKWIHTVCSYDGSAKRLSLFVDGEEKASYIAALPEDKFQHGDGQPMGLGNRAGSLSNPAQYAGDGHFEGTIDDFVMWNRTLSADEVKKLYESGKPVSLQGQDVPETLPTEAPTSVPTFRPTAMPTKAPSQNPSAPPTSSPSTQPSAKPPSPTFHPAYLDSLSSFSLIRFMDWANTNSNQVSQWKHRNKPTSVSQTHAFYVTKDIISVVESDPTPFSGDWLIRVTTAEPHDLTTGQRIDIQNTDGSVILDSGETVSFNVANAMVEVMDDLNFLVTYRGWTWTLSTHSVQAFVNGTTGSVLVHYKPGVSLEHQIELANVLKKDAWFNVPHLADDDYVFQMAQMINETLDSGLKAYIEYSNEIWNWAPGFVQTRYAYNMATMSGETRGDRHLVWYGRRCKEIFSIFDEAFGGRGKASERLVRVVAVQAGSGNVQLEFAGGIGGSDALAIAPYFGGALNAEVYGMLGWESLTTDEILDMARREVIDATLYSTGQSAIHAKQYGVKLIAYEGGQHMGGCGGCGSAGDCCNINALQKKFQAANHDPRIKGLYRNMLKAWTIGGESNIGVFTAFSHIAFDSKCGSWGALQHQLENVSTAWKYQALTENIGF